jgi:hypothetical protein
MIYHYSLSQVKVKGIIETNFINSRKGDTVDVLGYDNKYSSKYLIKDGDKLRYMGTSHVKVLTNDLNFWELKWFYYRSEQVAIKGWELDNRAKISNISHSYATSAVDDGMVYENEYLYDYIYQKLLTIYPERIEKKKATNFRLLLLKSNHPATFAFDDGLVVMTTAAIARTESEKDLVFELAKAISSIVLEMNLQYLNDNPYKTIPLVNVSNISAVKYEAEQVKKMKDIAKDYLTLHPQSFTLSEKEYITRVSDAISYTAWQQYYTLHYQKAHQLTTKLEELNLATEEDYLLLSKLTRFMHNDEQTNKQALGYVVKAREEGVTKLIDLEKEAGIIFMRLGEKENAKMAFMNYKKGLLELGNTGVDVSDELKKLEHLMFRYNMTN